MSLGFFYLVNPLNKMSTNLKSKIFQIDPMYYYEIQM